MKISAFLKLLQITVIAFAFLFVTSYTTPVAQAQSKKPDFAGKIEDLQKKGGKSSLTKKHGKKKVRKGKKSKKKAKKSKNKAKKKIKKAKKKAKKRKRREKR